MQVTRGRVLVYAHTLELGGSPINAVDLAAGVRAFGYESVVVAPADARHDGPSLIDVAADQGVPLETFGRAATTPAAARDLSRTAARHQADLVHVYGSWSIRDAYWGPCLLGQRPLVITVYEMRVAPFVYRAPSLIVGAGYLVDDLRDRRGPVHLVSPPVDLHRDDTRSVSTKAFLAEHALEPKHVRIVIISRLDRRRPVKSTGVEIAMRALCRLRPPEVDLVIVGGGNQEGRLRAIGEEVNTALGRRACVFTGAMANPRPAYAAADVVLGMGGSAARGLSFGKPLVVVGEYGWFKTFVPENAAALFRTSFWNEERTANPVDELIRELAPLLASADERMRLGRFGRVFAESNFGLTAMAERLASIYDQARAGYRTRDWLYDQRLESRNAVGWLARRLFPSTALSLSLRRWSEHGQSASDDPMADPLAPTPASSTRSSTGSSSSVGLQSISD